MNQRLPKIHINSHHQIFFETNVLYTSSSLPMHYYRRCIASRLRWLAKSVSVQHGENALIPQAIRTWRSVTFSGPERVTIGNPKPIGSAAIFQSITSGRIEYRYIERYITAKVPCRGNRWSSSACTRRTQDTRLQFRDINSLSGVCPILSQGYFTAGRSRIIDLVHASYT